MIQKHQSFTLHQYFINKIILEDQWKVQLSVARSLIRIRGASKEKPYQELGFESLQHISWFRKLWTFYNILKNQSPVIFMSYSLLKPPLATQDRLSSYPAASKVAVFVVILVRIFPHSDWIRRDTVYLSVFCSNAEKCEPE